ncbi:MAG: polyprenol monophosphomannose synthase [Candidatus Bathyarchaeia archaeon]
MQLSQVTDDLKLSSDVGIILPTYCESENIERVIREIEELKLNCLILVVDDSSPDGTAEIVRRLQKQFGNIFLMRRKEKYGLGTALTDGFKFFLSLKRKPKCIVTMDADYSHNPADIPKLVKTFECGYDLVVGSRYCRGGGIRNWNFPRLMISKIANLLASLRVKAHIHDYTSGFRCYSIKVVESIIDDLHSQTYEIQIETIRQTCRKEFSITEAPIIFVNRKKGKSKLTFNEVRQFIKYALLKS